MQLPRTSQRALKRKTLGERVFVKTRIMSQLIGRSISNLSSSTSELRFLSTAARPYLLLRDDLLSMSSSGEKVININILDPCKQETMKIPKQTLSKELNQSIKAGSSKGWVALLNLNDLKLHLTNVYI